MNKFPRNRRLCYKSMFEAENMESRFKDKHATSDEIIDVLLSMENERQREVLCRFFKTGKGQYGEGDSFLGLKVPQTRSVVKAIKGSVSLQEIERLLYSKWHEVRLCGFLLLVEEMKNCLPKRRDVPTKYSARRLEIMQLYLRNARQANNWDLVDLSCEYILGEWLLYPLPNGEMPSRTILDDLAESENLWEQRIAIVSTLTLIRNNQYDDTLRIAKKYLSHSHDLIHKATGWMLREIGKRDMEILREFLTENIMRMPRTTLRYAIEKMDVLERSFWMDKERTPKR